MVHANSLAYVLNHHATTHLPVELTDPGWIAIWVTIAIAIVTPIATSVIRKRRAGRLRLRAAQRTDAQIVRAVLKDLEGRRVLISSVSDEEPLHTVSSVLAIRVKLSEALGQVSAGSTAAKSLTTMRTAASQFLKEFPARRRAFLPVRSKGTKVNTDLARMLPVLRESVIAEMDRLYSAYSIERGGEPRQ